ncbi:MAG: cobalt-precorrin-5B (C(1))-methyltransferase CbiD [Methanobacteriaceae archaeon]|nr:cobalt-precorrin-5B (C(1))-methyltransferase CbiD [Methanobacteriaceae archaeon]MDP2837261.1 cobalt-precorrin-5B (C(1))-methyltransferase CbiD [Methanobacteriaceae archaeon]MDP3622514.1 cobalt-precorrin-5B (C(1))-methyltransferase CbiD [Methanobacteriaceae archaeon]
MTKKDEGISFGITTGSTATAAALAALKIILEDKIHTHIKISIPSGELEIEIYDAKKISKNMAQASVVKKPYPDPDVTINLEIGAKLELTSQPGISIKGGEGVGTITKPGLQIPVGQAAINPVPQKMIRKNIQRYLPSGKGAIITIFVPKGKEIASRTMNPRLGIINGISILGTTGIARPMSLESFKKANSCQLDIALGQGYEELIFVPGNIGEKLALQSMDVEKDQIIHMSNYVGYMLEQAVKKKVKKIILFGHAGKLVKIAGGIFNTKHSVADGRREIVTAHAALVGVSQDTLKEIFYSKTTEDMIDILIQSNKEKEVFNSIAWAIKENIKDRYHLELEVIIVRMNGTVLNSNKN